MDGIRVKHEDCEIALDPLLLVCAGVYKPSFTTKSSVLASFSEAQIKWTEKVISVETLASTRNVVSKVSRNVVCKAWFRHFLS